MPIRSAAAPLALLLLASGASGQPLSGDIFVTEKAAGSVLNVRGGGDLAGSARFATGLSDPTGICVTSAGTVLVAESGSGEVTDVTSGGDFTGASSFARGLDAPMGLLCDAARILVVERAPGELGRITDITAGGDFTAAPAFAAGIGSEATALLLDAASGRLFVSDADLGRVFDASAGGSLASATPVASNGAGTAGLASVAGQLLAANPVSGSVADFSAGDDLGALPAFATVPGVVNLLPVDGSGLLAASASAGAVYEISSGGNFTAATAFATGLALDPAFAGMARVGGCGNGTVDPGEACDDGNLENGDGCDASCRVRLCLIPPAPDCVVPDEASLSMSEKQTEEKLARKFSASLQGFLTTISPGDFGDPVSGATRFDVCLYEGGDRLAFQLIVDRGLDTCGDKEKPCWRSVAQKGYKYADPGLDASGVSSIVALGGDFGEGRLKVKAERKNDSSNLGNTVGAFVNDQKATLQVMVSDGRCFGAVLEDVKRNDERKFQATKK